MEFALLFVHLCVWAWLYARVHSCSKVHMEAKGQPWVSFLRDCALFSFLYFAYSLKGVEGMLISTMLLWKEEDNFQEWVLYFDYVGLRGQTKVHNLEVRTFPH